MAHKKDGAHKIIFDTDPGVDDTMALFFALNSPEIDIVGITTVYGNTDIEHTTRNALRILEEAGRETIPVAKGAGRPLVVTSELGGQFVHHEDGLGGAADKLGEPSGEPISMAAAQYIVETVMAYPGEITLVPVGPLTNIALALRLEPCIAQQVKEVVIMGGAIHGGNVSPVAEANVHNDPHASQIVFSAGWPFTMVGLDVTEKVFMDNDYLARLDGIGNKASNFIAQVYPFYRKAHESFGVHGGFPVHDSSAIAYLVAPELFTTETISVFVETEGHCAGATIADKRRQWKESTEINVCMGVNAEGLLALYYERISQAP